MKRAILVLVGLALVLFGTDVLARRFLMGGGGAFTAPLVGIPTDGSWSRSGSNPVVAPTQAWEETSVQEPSLRPDGTGWKLWYKGGWASGGAVGYATSTNGTTFTHYASNPVLGRGGSGNASTISQPQVFDNAGTLYLYANSPADTTNSPYLWTSTDGLTWTIANGGTAYISLASVTSYGNRFTWKEGATWYQLLEARIGAGAWQIYLLSGTTGISDWAVQNGGSALTSLKPGGSYNVGGPCLAYGGPFGGTYHLYYHSGLGSNSDIYHATSMDRTTWTIANGGSPILTHSGSGDEVDQVADPDIHLSSGTWYMWFAGVDNATSRGRILLATAPATQ